ncbi:Thiol-disulfide oxidoreductase ResA [compost metagenome]
MHKIFESRATKNQGFEGKWIKKRINKGFDRFFRSQSKIEINHKPKTTKLLMTHMKKMTTIRSGLATAMMFLACTVQAQYFHVPTLKIGDPAPPMIVETWLRGNPVKNFEKGKVYVVDFWATWCGGCIASFPHLSAIADKHKDNVRFISVDSYEIDVLKKGGNPAAAVKDFLETPPGKRLSIDVSVDRDSSMFSGWIKPLRRRGFPTTFVIDQEGKLAWIDVNLDQLDWVLQQVLARKWDNKKSLAIMEQRDAIEDQFFKTFQEKDPATKRKNYQEILSACESLEKQYPDRKDAAAFYKVMALSELDKKRVPLQLEEMAANPLSRYIHLDDAAGLISRRTDLTQRDYAAIAKVQERLLLNEHNGTGRGGKTLRSYEGLATTYAKLGDKNKAVANMEKAIAIANTENTDPEQIKKLNAALSKYKTLPFKKS